MINQQNVPGDDEQPEPEQRVVQNRRERRGHAKKNAGVNVIPGRPHQANFVGRRVFRRTGG
ncbi:hypothetical protein [Saccharothrix australiensis]|uniref:Uncharacterized protein n=1 Tax=Saccharothrix australiensis TaxID=2072 RepID=A0A495VY99_9PSEU|nr:hypothetical protein [Saccharothrix australiensis]RKT53365.1 hypothetical protein C8E97_1924 [Saccharothrix australiensis]